MLMLSGPCYLLTNIKCEKLFDEEDSVDLKRNRRLYLKFFLLL